MESIDKLREYGARFNNSYDAWSGIGTEILEFADEIEHDFDEMWHALTIDAKPMTDENMAESGWVRLPVDADGEVIHVGDKVDSDYYEDGTVTGIQFYEMANGGIRTLIAVRPDGWDVPTWRTPVEYRHHHAPTVEDVLREFAAKLCIRDGFPTATEETFAEYAAKLTLRGDE